MSDFSVPGLADMVTAPDQGLEHLARGMAAAMIDPRDKSADQRPISFGRRQVTVLAVNPGPPLTADVDLDGTLVPGAHPQSTYRPQVGDQVWLEIQGGDSQISPPVTSTANGAWTPLARGAGWSHFSFAPWNSTLAYWRDPMGIVRLRGAVAGGNSGTVIATLPVGYRPPVNFAAFSVFCLNLSNIPEAAVVQINTVGEIEYRGPNGPVPVALDNVAFRVD